MENFAKEFMTHLNGKVSDDELEVILRELEVFSGNYDIQKKETALVEYTPQIPECYKVYMISKKIEGLRPSTLNTYGGYLKDFFFTVNKPLHQITTNDIRTYLYTYQQTHKVINRTMDGKRLVLNTFFEWCRDEGYINKNPCKQIHPIKYNVRPLDPLTGIELEVVRDACKTYREKAIIETLYSTGCRVSELMNLSKNDINFQTKEVMLLGKGNKYRISYINARAEVALKKYLDIRTDDNTALFVGERKPHNGIKKTTIEKIVREIGQRSGIGRRVYPHLIRHTTGTDALMRGMTLPELQELFGHVKPETTMIYAKTCRDNIKHNHQRCIV